MTIQNGTIISTQTDTNIYHKVSDIARGNIEYVMSRSDLMEFDKCPHRWVQGYSKTRTDSMSYGNLLDAYLLESGRFDDQFAIAPETYAHEKGDKPWNWNATVCREWREEQHALGKEVIKKQQYEECILASKVLYSDKMINGILSTSNFQVMITAEWKDKDTGLTIPLKCLIDIVPKKGLYLIDFKTCKSASLGQWPREVYNWGYHIQAAFYMDMYEAATGEVRNGFAHILQESYAPYEVGKRLLDEEFIELGREKYINAIKKYCECLKSGKFGGYDDYSLYMLKFDGFTSVGPESWMIDKI